MSQSTAQRVSAQHTFCCIARAATHSHIHHQKAGDHYQCQSEAAPRGKAHFVFDEEASAAALTQVRGDLPVPTYPSDECHVQERAYNS